MGLAFTIQNVCVLWHTGAPFSRNQPCQRVEPKGNRAQLTLFYICFWEMSHNRFRDCRSRGAIMQTPAIEGMPASLFLPLISSGHCFRLIPASGSFAAFAFPVPPLPIGFPPIKQPLGLFARLKIAVFALMPIVKVSTASTGRSISPF